jgi:hypothetical protein
MPSPELRVPVEVIRREAQLACDAASLRSVAGEVGMSPMGLRSFIRGEGQQQERSLRKLNFWYARRLAFRLPEGEQEARSSLIVLAAFYPLADRSRVQARVLDVMEEEFRESGMTPPPWLAALRADLREDAD